MLRVACAMQRTSVSKLLLQSARQRSSLPFRRLFSSSTGDGPGTERKRNPLSLLVWTSIFAGCGYFAGTNKELFLRTSTDDEKKRDDDNGNDNVAERLALPPVPEVVYDAAIVGGGVVGLAVARELAVTFPDRKFVVLEKSQNLAGEASAGNSGLGCTGYDAPAGSLERQLLRRSAQRHPNLYRSMGLSYVTNSNECVRSTGKQHNSRSIVVRSVFLWPAQCAVHPYFCVLRVRGACSSG